MDILNPRLRPSPQSVKIKRRIVWIRLVFSGSSFNYGVKWKLVTALIRTGVFDQVSIPFLDFTTI